MSLNCCQHHVRRADDVVVAAAQDCEIQNQHSLTAAAFIKLITTRITEQKHSKSFRRRLRGLSLLSLCHYLTACSLYLYASASKKERASLSLSFSPPSTDSKDKYLCFYFAPGINV